MAIINREHGLSSQVFSTPGITRKIVERMAASVRDIPVASTDRPILTADNVIRPPISLSPQSGSPPLTQREQEVQQLYSDHTILPEQIARQLGISMATLKEHRWQLSLKGVQVGYRSRGKQAWYSRLSSHQLQALKKQVRAEFYADEGFHQDRLVNLAVRHHISPRTAERWVKGRRNC